MVLRNECENMSASAIVREDKDLEFINVDNLLRVHCTFLPGYVTL